MTNNYTAQKDPDNPRKTVTYYFPLNVRELIDQQAAEWHCSNNAAILRIIAEWAYAPEWERIKKSQTASDIDIAIAQEETK